ncbi:MAG: 50S ribosomal protein L9 [Chlamydiota bacterium]|nr:50S ribosomal protein L9 [Chlamydiota bacterium]
MEVLLLQDREKVGKAGDVIKVANGYARNFLIPKRIAMQATPNAILRSKELSQKIQLQQMKTLEEFKLLADRMNDMEINIPVKVGKTGKLFGRITNLDIARALSKESITIDRRKILLVEPIKELGVHKVSLRLHPHVEATLKVVVVGS